ncbi:ABC transporter permease [Paucibacter sp. Y2R2-4]|uniref:ABC transporter permease n=1 Tax=Paucibacter sp. Y2R2-4 TaxID=2893553 RepID=UPI0021E4148F|nr:MlaE family lipid ABC transporter permease subunit [Paucibacter sp. Y2R2-4]MCV2352263.1 MlaE family lipid ABC transporter permease subunit [Paucibacter sp. Y2R2-4]
MAPRDVPKPAPQQSLSDAAACQLDSEGRLQLSGRWTALGLGDVMTPLSQQASPSGQPLQVEASQILALDTVGAWALQKLLLRLGAQDAPAPLIGLPTGFARLLSEVADQLAPQPQIKPIAATVPKRVEALGRYVSQHLAGLLDQAHQMLSFIGECTQVLLQSVAHPGRWRWRACLFNLRSAGFDALPIVGLLSFLLGLVVAYQGASQLRQYGANIFVADLVGLSMLREFAPLITAIIVAGRSGSAYTAQIGTMAVTEEIDAMRTLGLVPIELLVLPKLIALLIALPLLTVFADVLGVMGGMLMATVQLEVSVTEFAERFVKAVSVTSYLLGLGKAPVFAAIIVVVGCFQGFQTRGGADSVGQHTTRSVVQSIFAVIVADALFSVAFSALDL